MSREYYLTIGSIGSGSFEYISDVELYWGITETIEDICSTNGVPLSKEEVRRLDKLNNI